MEPFEIKMIRAQWKAEPGQWKIENQKLLITMPGGKVYFECEWPENVDMTKPLIINLDIPICRP